MTGASAQSFDKLDSFKIIAIKKNCLKLALWNAKYFF